VAHWEGPFDWDTRKEKAKTGHVLYALYGSRHLYGRDVLLYIGKTAAGVGSRLKGHEQWVADEYDTIRFRLASIGRFWDRDDWDDGDRYPKATPSIVNAVESLLIYAHQPAYNSQNVATLERAKGVRVLNTGRMGHLLPEISYLYYEI
jgi:hypothetical protein